MRRGLWILTLLMILLSYPPQWYPTPMRVQLTKWFGAADFRAVPASLAPVVEEPESFCPPDPESWREAFEIEGVSIEASAPCVADNPWAVAASVLGTNNVSADTLARSGLTSDAVVIGRDLDQDGDPDEIHIRLEVAELNGASAIDAEPVTKYEIAPGIRPGLWVFAPKFTGMAVENFESQVARSFDDLVSMVEAEGLQIEDVQKITIVVKYQNELWPRYLVQTQKKDWKAYRR